MGTGTTVPSSEGSAIGKSSANVQLEILS